MMMNSLTTPPAHAARTGERRAGENAGSGTRSLEICGRKRATAGRSTRANRGLSLSSRRSGGHEETREGTSKCAGPRGIRGGPEVSRSRPTFGSRTRWEFVFEPDRIASDPGREFLCRATINHPPQPPSMVCCPGHRGKGRWQLADSRQGDHGLVRRSAAPVRKPWTLSAGSLRPIRPCTARATRSC